MTSIEQKPTFYGVYVCDEDTGGSEMLRAFSTEQAAETYAARRPEESWVAPISVDDEVPEVRTYVESVFLMTHYRAGVRWWTGPTTAPEVPGAVGISLRVVFDSDAVPSRIEDVPVGVTIDPEAGSIRVFGTDEDAVRVAYVKQVGMMLASAGEARA